MGAILGQNYYLVVNGYEWTTARTNAQNLGGDLVVIDSSSENDFLVANFRSEITIDDWSGGARGGAWIGLNQNTERSDREWVDGTAISYTNYGQDGGQDKASLPYHGGYLLLMKQNGSNDDTWWVEPVDPLTFYSIDSSAWAYRYGIAEVPLSYFSISDLTLSEGDTSSITISRTGGSNSSQNIIITSSDGTASAGSDYAAVSQTITFAAGETSKTKETLIV